MQIDIVNIEGKKVGQVDLADAVFGTKVKEYLLWEVVKMQRAARRAGTHKTKKRDEVRGGGKKPYKQKGTGNARQGSTRSPQFVGGGKVLGTAAARLLVHGAQEGQARRAGLGAVAAREREEAGHRRRAGVRRAEDQAVGRHPQGAGR